MNMPGARRLALLLTLALGLALMAAGCGGPAPTTAPTSTPTAAPVSTPPATAAAPSPTATATPWPTPTLVPTPTRFQLSDTGKVTRDELVARMQPVVLKDAIPAILKPRFVPPELVPPGFKDQELVLGMSINGESKAYPLDVLSHHEIVNDVVGGKPVVVTW